MGQAKRRGDFESRKQQSIDAAAAKAAADEASRIEKVAAYKAWFDALPEDQQALVTKRHKELTARRRRAASVIGMGLMLGGHF